MDAFEVLREDKVAAVLRAPRVPEPARTADALAAVGIRCVEFTFTIPDVEHVIEAASRTDAVVGAGTVMTGDQARRAIEAGARFIVSPSCRPQLTEPCRRAGIPLFLGAFTPTEIGEALDLGARAVKIFPARLGGPSYIKDLRGPFPEVAFIPSGGVDENNAADYLSAGCPAVYAGSKLAPPDVIEAGDIEEIATRAKRFVTVLR